MPNDREIDKKESASNARHALRTYIDAKNAESSFSDLTKICQRIRSISMRKDQIFSALFVFLDRVSALQDRVCNDCIVRFLEAILCDFKSYLYSTLLRSDIDLTSCHTRLYNTFLRSRTI